MIIQLTPNLSATMPKRLAKNVLLERHLHLAAFAERGEHLVGLGFVLGGDRQRDALEFRLAGIVAVRRHQRRVADLEARRASPCRRLPGAQRLPGRFLEAHQHADLGADRLLVELDRFLAAAVEHQIGGNLHGASLLAICLLDNYVDINLYCVMSTRSNCAAECPSRTHGDVLPFSATIEVRDACLCLHVQRAARMLARRFDEALRPFDLTSGQFSLLVSLNRPEPPTIGSVATCWRWTARR